MRFKEFQSKVLQNAFDLNHRWVYRGQSQTSWELMTSYSRFLNLLCGPKKTFNLRPFNAMMSRFLLRSSELTGTNYEHFNLFQKMAMVRHYGIPTPILDWSHSPYVATYFGAIDAIPAPEEEVSFCVFALDIDNLQPKDVSDGREKLEEIAAENSFLFIDTKNFIIPRIARQRGCFTYHGFNECLLSWNREANKLLLRKYEIQDYKKNIICELKLMGLTGGALFDDLDYIARDVQSEEADSIRFLTK